MGPSVAFHFRTHTLLVALAAAQSAAHDAAQSYALSQCAIVQLGTVPRLYLALPDSALAAVDVRSGALLWRTKKAAYPLMARNDRLLALLPPPPAGQGWRLAVLDARSGRILARLSVWGAGSGTLEAGLGSSTAATLTHARSLTLAPPLLFWGAPPTSPREGHNPCLRNGCVCER